jgi:hypothetical protein
MDGLFGKGIHELGLSVPLIGRVEKRHRGPGQEHAIYVHILA